MANLVYNPFTTPIYIWINHACCFIPRIVDVGYDLGDFSGLSHLNDSWLVHHQISLLLPFGKLTKLWKITIIIVPADDMGVVGHTQKTQTPMSSAKWKTEKCISPVSSVKCLRKKITWHGTSASKKMQNMSCQLTHTLYISHPTWTKIVLYISVWLPTSSWNNPKLYVSS